jgi:hypothetical protein
MQIRLAQGPLDPETGQVSDPLAPERDVPQAEAATATSEADDSPAHDGEDAAAAPRES